MKTEALKDLLFRMADDALIIGHRNSEWTGLGPILEEDIAFSSMAQDKIGHAQAIYNILHSLGEKEADSLAFNREENDFRCCHFVEYPIGEYDFSIARHFLFDHAEFLRYEMLKKSSFMAVSGLAKKIFGELKYHILHADTWIKQLANGTEESKARMQTALDECYPMALGIFEKGDHENDLINDGLFEGEDELRSRWTSAVSRVISESGLIVPTVKDENEYYGGRKGFHTEYLKLLLKEMTEVFSLDPNAEW